MSEEWEKAYSMSKLKPPDKHYHMFQLLVHNNNDFYIVQIVVDHTMLVDMVHMD